MTLTRWTGRVSLIRSPLPCDCAAGLVDMASAYRAVHCPQEDDDPARANYESTGGPRAADGPRDPPRALPGAPAVARRPVPDGLLSALDARLPFEPTEGQRAVGEQIMAELSGEHPMHRPFQGEVGSGKTIVALRAMLAVVDAGGQAALLAPTEVLAAQHARSIHLRSWARSPNGDSSAEPHMRQR